ncbi:MAG: hypothetical protein OHK0044_06980 [Burkholderiaceae bacterium]
MLKTKVLVAIPLAALSMTAYAEAGDLSFFWEQMKPVHSTVTRAQVQSDLAAALASGEAPVGERGPLFIDPPSTRTRAQVIAERNEAIRLGVAGASEAGAPIATPAQEARITAAGRAAADEYAAVVK